MAAIAIVGIVASLVSPVIEIGKCIVSPIKRQFTYLCCFNSNIQSLSDEAQNLEDQRVALQREVDAAENNARVIVSEVRTWLENASNKIQVDKNRIDDEIPTVKNGCWGIKSRYRLSREAVKITGEMKKLVEDRNKFNDISTPPLPAAHIAIPLGTTYEFQSRKQIEEEIMKALRAKEVTTMGICGMGGVGKTTMAKKIMNRVTEENIFDETFMVVVSQQIDMLKIQDEIAESLGLTLPEKTLSARANKLHARLTGTKRILILLDDIWEKLKLEELGIPCEIGFTGCNILLTSRNKDVLEKVVQKVCAMETLSKTEAWFLFREKAGTCVDDPNLLSIAEKVVEECKGLPIALVAVGSALKDKNSIPIWKDVLQQLKSSNPEDVPDVIKDVYNPLKLSYTYLESKHAKSLFLLCCLFPEDFNISLEELTFYCMGLRMFEFLNLEQVRNRVFTIVDTLKSRFLLLEGKYERDVVLHVRMHDVVRDVAIYIASHEAKEEIADVKFNPRHSSREYTYEWFSEKKSSLLRMQSSSKTSFEMKDFPLFEEMKELNVLSIRQVSLTSLPLEIQLIKNLRTLRLEACKLESLFVVGELLSLEILYCTGCHEIEELPVEIGKLNQLKLLEFSKCFRLRRIPRGVISNLVELEEFKSDCFIKWELAETEVQGQERRNACLNEFENLSKLSCLEIEIRDFNLAAEEIRFSPNIVKYKIKIGESDRYHSAKHEKFMSLNLPREINLGSWVLKFLKGANDLELKGDGSKPLDLPQADSMKSLRFEYCSTVKELVNSTTTSIDVFPILELLSLYNLPNLEEVYDGPLLDQSNSFKNLECLYLDDLPALKHLCKRPTRIVSLDNLRSIWIRNCKNLLNLFSFTMANDVPLQLDRQNPNVSTGRHGDELLCTQQVFFPMLESLELSELDKLEVIWNAPIPEGSNSFKNLRKLTLSELPAMTHLWKSPSLNVSLSNLSEIHIHKCHKLRSLFSSTMSMDLLLQLRMLTIINCKTMEQVLLNEENKTDTNQCRTIQFKKLSNLALESLESLTAFSEEIESIEFPVLDCMSFENCPKMMSLLSSTGNNQNSMEGHDDDTFHLFCCQKVSLGSLKDIRIESYDISNLWCHQIPLGFFRQLQDLQINNCNGIRSLFLSSIAEELVDLKELEIWNCTEMVKVIEDDEKMLCEKPHILFPSLKTLILGKLPKLESFCNWGCELQLPSLDYVSIDECLLLEFFTKKSVSTPNLKSIEMDSKKKDVGDLKGTIQLHFEANQRQLISTTKESTSAEASEVEADHDLTKEAISNN